MRNSAVASAAEQKGLFLATQDALNKTLQEKQTLTEDGILGSIVDDLRRIAHGVDPTTLKDDNATQEALNVELNRISEVLEPLVAGDRQIDFAA